MCHDNENNTVIDHAVLSQLEGRLKRGIPKWEQEHFIEQVVPILIERLQKYLQYETQVQMGG